MSGGCHGALSGCYGVLVGCFWSFWAVASVLDYVRLASLGMCLKEMCDSRGAEERWVETTMIER